MDQMVKELKEQQKEEVDLKEFCNTKFNENEQQTFKNTDEKEDLEQKIDSLATEIERLTKEIKEAGETIANTEIEIKKASEAREKENAEYQTTVADQRATQVILKKALTKLESFYKKKALLQTSDEQTPPAQMEYKKRGGASAVMMMIEGIVKEAQDIEAKAIKEENEAQADYETFMKESEASIQAMAADVTNKSETIAKSDKEKVGAQDDLKHTIGEILSLGEASAALHSDCDWLVKNFDARQAARANEIDALNSAKAILSGAKFGFMQRD